MAYRTNWAPGGLDQVRGACVSVDKLVGRGRRLSDRGRPRSALSQTSKPRCDDEGRD